MEREEYAEPVAAHMGDEQAGEREEADGVDVPGHHRQRESDAVGGPPSDRRGP